MKVPSAGIIAMLTTYILLASASSASIPSRQSERHHSLNGSSNKKVRTSQHRMNGGRSMSPLATKTVFNRNISKGDASNMAPVRGTRILISKSSSTRYSTDVDIDEPYVHRRKGKGSDTGGSNNLKICLTRQFKNDEIVKKRSLQTRSFSESESRTSGKSGETRRKGKKRRPRNNQCKPSISKERGRGGSSKAKSLKGQQSYLCSDYDYSERQGLQQQREENGTIKNILDIARGIPRLSIFVDLVERSNVEAILACSGPFTVLVPANRAFRNLDTALFANVLFRDKNGKRDDVLLSHIIAGKKLSYEFDEGILKTISGDTIHATIFPLTFNNNVTVGTSDIVATNGVIHVIDTVLFTTVPESICDSGLFDFEGPTCGRGCEQNQIDVACEHPQLSIFLSLVQLSGLEEIFECEGPFTIFVPHNDAFDDLRGHVLLDLSKPENANALKNFLLYHTIPGSLFRRELESGDVKSLLPDKNITISRNPLMINSAKVRRGDFLSCNGVLHIINRVLDYTQPILAPPQPLTSPMSLTLSPFAAPSSRPEIVPATRAPTDFPVETSTVAPTLAHIDTTFSPSAAPIINPSKTPEVYPSSAPIVSQSQFPTELPTMLRSGSPSASPSSGVVRVNIEQSFFFAYASISSDEPTANEYDEIRQITISYYNEFINGRLAMTRPDIDFIEWNATLSNSRHNAGLPSPRFNIYMQYTMAVAIFTKESLNVPSPGEFLNLLKDGFVYDYILRLASLTGSPFEQLSEGVFSPEEDD